MIKCVLCPYSQGPTQFIDAFYYYYYFIVVVVAGSDFSCYPEGCGKLVQVLSEAPGKSYNREHLDALDLQFPL